MENIVINKIPSPTWSWCKMNKAELSYDVQLENMLPEVVVDGNAVFAENGTELWEKLPETVGGAGADSLFEDSLPVSVTAPKGKKAGTVVLNYNFAEGVNALTTQIVHAEEDSEVTVIVVSSSDKKAGGLQALKTELWAEKGSRIHLVKVQILGDDFVQADETTGYEAENASIEVTHVVLGGAKTYVGVGSNLKEYKAEFKSDLAYFVKGKQELDMNYIVPHYGKKTVCLMRVMGTLLDEAKKTYRGTIDFKNGCAGAEGDEQEEVLLLSPKAVNNSIPVILCDEEDVAGEHGASIGRLSEEQLFYMESRGISRETAENLMARAKVQRVVNKIENQQVVEKITAYMDELFGEI